MLNSEANIGENAPFHAYRGSSEQMTCINNNTVVQVLMILIIKKSLARLQTGMRLFMMYDCIDLVEPVQAFIWTQRTSLSLGSATQLVNFCSIVIFYIQFPQTIAKLKKIIAVVKQTRKNTSYPWISYKSTLEQRHAFTRKPHHVDALSTSTITAIFSFSWKYHKMPTSWLGLSKQDCYFKDKKIDCHVNHITISTVHHKTMSRIARRKPNRGIHGKAFESRENLQAKKSEWKNKVAALTLNISASLYLFFTPSSSQKWIHKHHILLTRLPSLGWC